MDLLGKLAQIVLGALVIRIVVGEVSGVAALLALKMIGQIMPEDHGRAVPGDLGIEVADRLAGIVLGTLQEMRQGTGIEKSGLQNPIADLNGRE